MAYEDNEFSNGANGRFDGLEEKFKAGGQPRGFAPEKREAIASAIEVVAAFFTKEPQTLEGDISTTDLLLEFKQVRDLKDAIDILDKEAGRLHDFLRLVAVPARFEAEGISNMKVVGVGRVQLAGDLYAGIVKGREDSAFEWLDDNGRGDLVKRTVNSSSLKAVLKQALQNGEELPDFFKAEPFTRASIVKA